jgi:hypothetical protein
VLDDQSFRAAGCVPDHYLAVAEVRDRLSVSKREKKRFDMERCNIKKLNDVKIKQDCQIKISNSFETLENFDEKMGINGACERIS